MTDEKLEALKWIESKKVVDFAANAFDYKSDAVEFIRGLYLAGATEVLINNETILYEDNELYADAIIIKLPDDLSKRNNVLNYCQTKSQSGWVVNIENDFVYLWWD